MSGGHARRSSILDRIGWALLGIAVLTVVVVALFGDRIDLGGDSGPKPPTAREMPPAPAGAPEIGMYVDSEVTDSGEVTVGHWITTSEPVTQLTINAADPDQLPGGVVADKVVVVGEGIVLARRQDVSTKPQTLRLNEPATRLYVAYTLIGGVDEEGSVAGRVLARSLSLDIDYEGESGPVVRRVSGPGTVLNAACLRRDDNDRNPRPCGQADDAGWLVELDGADRDDRLLVQLET